MSRTFRGWTGRGLQGQNVTTVQPAISQATSVSLVLQVSVTEVEDVSLRVKLVVLVQDSDVVDVNVSVELDSVMLVSVRLVVDSVPEAV